MRVLSVSGLLAIMGRFLPERGFILRVEGPTFSPGIPTRVEVGVKSADGQPGWCT